MPDHTPLNPGSGGDTIATDEITDGGVANGVKVQRLKAGYGPDNEYRDVEDAFPLPVAPPVRDRDGFGRYRVATVQNIFENQLQYDKGVLIWDEQITNGSGNATSTHSLNDGEVRLHVESGDTIIRQTFERFHYQPGKSQLVMLSGSITSASGAGITARIGTFDADDGVFFEYDGTQMYAVIRKNGVDSTRIAQSAWNVDPLDGTGPSGVTFDPTQIQLFIMDIQWLGGGRVRWGFSFNGQIHYVHYQDHANVIPTVYMASANLPLRVEAASSGTTFEMAHACANVLTEGGNDPLGQERYISTGATPLDADAAGTLYAAVGVRLQASRLRDSVILDALSAIALTNDSFEIAVLRDPVVAGTFTYTPVANSAVEVAIGATANTVTGGTLLSGAYVAEGRSGLLPIRNIAPLGAAIDGTPVTLVMAIRPLSVNLDVLSSLNWRERL